MKYGVAMHPKHKDWIKVPLFLEELKGLFEELSDEELDNLKRSVVEGGRKYLEEKKRLQIELQRNRIHQQVLT